MNHSGLLVLAAVQAPGQLRVLLLLGMLELSNPRSSRLSLAALGSLVTNVPARFPIAQHFIVRRRRRCSGSCEVSYGFHTLA